VKILIVACGQGQGHVGRTLEVSDELKKRGHEILWATYNNAVDFVKRHKFSVKRIQKISFDQYTKKGRFAFSKLYLNLPKTMLYEQSKQMLELNKIIKKFKPDVILSDSEISPIIISKIKRIPCGIIIHQLRMKVKIGRKKYAKIGWYKQFGIADKIFLPDFPEENMIYTLNKPIPKKYESKIIYSGVMCREREENLPSKKKIKKDWGIKSNKPLIYCGISGPGKSADLFSKKVVKFLRNNEEFIFVLSRGNPKGSSIKKEDNLIIADWIKDEINVKSKKEFERFKLIKASDLVFCRSAYTTVMELIKFGRESVMIPNPGTTEQEFLKDRLNELKLTHGYNQNELEKIDFKTIIKDKEMKKKLRYYKNLSKKYDAGKIISDEIEDLV